MAKRLLMMTLLVLRLTDRADLDSGGTVSVVARISDYQSVYTIVTSCKAETVYTILRLPGNGQSRSNPLARLRLGGSNDSHRGANR
jgi:hypothetical protein